MDTRKDSQRRAYVSSAMRRKIMKRRKLKRVLRAIAKLVGEPILLGTAVILPMIVLLYAWVNEPTPDWSDYIHGQEATIELSENFLVTPEEYNEIMAEKEAWEQLECSEIKLNTCMTQYPPAHSVDWDSDESYMLAKLAMAEAEGESPTGKAMVIEVVINRVWDEEFPGSIEDVIYEKNQFACIANGRYDRVEPDDECWQALEMAMWDLQRDNQLAMGATYYEVTPKGSSWHNRNLIELFTIGNHTFYKEGEQL